MSELPSTKTPSSRSHVALLAVVSVLLFSLAGYGGWRYFVARYSVSAPGTLQTKSRAAIAALRAAPQPSPPEPSAQAASPQPSSRTREPISQTEYEIRLECFLHGQRQIAQKTAAKLKNDFPELDEILKSEDSRPYADAIPPLLQRLLDAAKSAAPERKPLLLLATDFIAGRLVLPMKVPATPELQRQLNELAAQGLTYRWAELDGEWAYQNDVLWRVWREYPSTEEGEDAFVLLLSKGWDTTRCCGKGSDNFRAVIREGEAFLAKRPESPHRLDVAFLLAQAYETWWSLSLITEQEEGDPPPGAYQGGATEAREKAIAYYEEVISKAPDGPEAQCSRKPLEMLRANQDTQLRRFYCYCD